MAVAPARFGQRRRGGRRARLAPAVLCLQAALLVGCPCTVEQLDRVFEEDWESCDGLCGWELLEGEAAVVETFHSSEHALQFAGERTTVRHLVAVDAARCSDGPCAMQLSVVTNCHSGLAVEGLYHDAYGAETAQAAALECTSAGGTLQYCQGPLELGLTDEDGRVLSQLAALRLQSTRAGCVVDDIILQTFFLFCGA